MSLGENNLLAKVGLDATILLAAVTGLLYVTGTYYRIGYLDQWGIESSLFASDIYENLVAGFSVLSIIIGLLFIISAAIGVSTLQYNYIAKKVWESKFTQKKVSWLNQKIYNWKSTKSDIEPSKLLKKIDELIIKLLQVCLVILVWTCVFHVIIYLASNSGKTHAVKEYERYSQSNTQGDQKILFNKLKTYCIDGVQRNALLLATDRSAYALYFPKTKTAAESVEIIAASRINGISAAKNGSSFAMLSGSCPPTASAASSSARP